jgi:hypothetical protein
MSEETHEYLRPMRNRVIDDLRAFEAGKLEVWDIGVRPSINVSQTTIDRLRAQLYELDALMAKWGVSVDA